MITKYVFSIVEKYDVNEGNLLITDEPMGFSDDEVGVIKPIMTLKNDKRTKDSYHGDILNITRNGMFMGKLEFENEEEYLSTIYDRVEEFLIFDLTENECGCEDVCGECTLNECTISKREDKCADCGACEK